MGFSCRFNVVFRVETSCSCVLYVDCGLVHDRTRSHTGSCAAVYQLPEGKGDKPPQFLSTDPVKSVLDRGTMRCLPYANFVPYAVHQLDVPDELPRRLSSPNTKAVECYQLWKGEILSGVVAGEFREKLICEVENNTDEE